MNNLMVIDGIEVRRDVHGRYCLNDLHRAAGGEQKYRPKYWLDNKQTRELIEQLFTEGGIPPSEQNQSVSFFQGGSDTQNLGIAPVNTVRGGAEQGTYVCKELVFAYAMWISPSFHLKVIRTFDRITSAPQTLFFEPEGEGFSLPPDSPALHVIQHIRDESHDHAIGGHRKKRAKVKNTSTLETIEGVGPKRRQMLLKYMGGLQGLRNASVEEIAKVPGISQGLAEKIFWSLKH